MRFFGALVFHLAIPICLFGQFNLVINPSFELFDSCPYNQAQLAFCNGWNSPTLGSPDYFNACDQINTFGTPFNYGGFQIPKDGQSYAGIYSLLVLGLNYREYLQGSLVAPMKEGNCYHVELFVSLADSKCRQACSSIGVYFSSTSVSDFSGTSPLGLEPQLINLPTNLLSDTSSWMKLEWQYLATGGEQYITIGNFDYDSVLVTSLVNTNIQVDISYYFIDAILVQECDVEIPNVFTPNNDGTNDLFIINSSGLKSFSLKIFNRWGTIVSIIDQPLSSWDGSNTSGNHCQTGLYYYVLEGVDHNGNQQHYKGTVHLMR